MVVSNDSKMLITRESFGQANVMGHPERGKCRLRGLVNTEKARGVRYDEGEEKTSSGYTTVREEEQLFESEANMHQGLFCVEEVKAGFLWFEDNPHRL
ncbi:hypothetical protein AAFF_G00023370 [Aldrovandia affinis]|uniref:Uncharacterized protein n=1 Tax=Aldrovandia affinis TaxID=143900 RepID=A0AAD7T5J1_9TELE|nr:hypothetical protein AAFF_G00023370 [Aldrovandia affinis]